MSKTKKSNYNTFSRTIKETDEILNNVKQDKMTASQILKAGQKNIKPAYLIETKEELILERDFMEANWRPEFTQRMAELSRISSIKFKTPLSQL